MNEYPTLRKLSYQKPGQEETQYAHRFYSDSAVHCDFFIGENQLFYCVLPQMATQVEKIMQQEKTVQTLMSQLPGMGKQAFIRNQVAYEINSSNDIEGIHSTRKEIQEALDASDKNNRTRFVEVAKLYNALFAADGKRYPLETVQDIRSIYDVVTRGEIASDDQPDGDFFRAQPVNVVSASQKVVHRGFMPEENIIKGMEAMLREMRQPSSTELFSAFLSHLMFEMVHPFYDGNGRTGRYLLARQLCAPLLPTTVFTLSSVINDRKQEYYAMFKTVGDPLNRAEATHFILLMMEFVIEAQERAIKYLETKQQEFNVIVEHYQTHERDGIFTNQECGILFVLSQARLFEDCTGVDLETLVECTNVGCKGTVRKLTRKLEDNQYIKTIRQRPLRFVITDRAFPAEQISA